MSIYADILKELLSDRDNLTDVSDVMVRDFLELKIGKLIDLQEAIDVEILAGILAEEVKNINDPSRFDDKIRDLLTDISGDSDLSETRIKQVMPDLVIKSLDDLTSRPYQVEQDLVEPLIKHPVMRTVIQNVLDETLRKFVNRTATWLGESNNVPGMSKAWKIFSGMFGMARNYTTRFTQKLEESLQTQIDSFINDVIEEVLDTMVREVCSQPVAEDFARWRSEALSVLMDQKLITFLDQMIETSQDKGHVLLDENIVETISVSELEETLRPVVLWGVQSMEERTIGEILALFNVRDYVKQEGVEVIQRFLKKLDGQ